MANEEALKHTVPLFLQSLRRLIVSSGKNAGQTLDARLVVVTWSLEATQLCQGLRANYSHQCVRDAEHRAATGSFGFHSEGFNALGFAKMKYILNGLSAGHDTLFLDTDILTLRDPLPYLLSRNADLFAASEKCLYFNDTHAFHSGEFLALKKNPPPLNIGVLYFKASPGVTRCVYNWAWDMYQEVAYRPMVWDQDIFGKIVIRCAAVHGLRMQVLDPRLFQSGCFPECGCAYEDSKLTPDNIGRFSRGAQPLPDQACGPQHWGGWLLRHFPCSGATKDKAGYMGAMLEAMRVNGTARITKRGARRRRGRRRA